MKNTLLITPDNLFQQLETIVTKKPELLRAGNYHQTQKGLEAFTEEQILDKSTSHCLAGWVIALTPNAPRFEHMRLDVDDFANEILRMNDRRPVPLAIYHSDEESMLKIIKMRAAEERVERALNPKTLYN
jgi:hypothetical protein